MFLRFDEVSSMMLLLCLCRRRWLRGQLRSCMWSVVIVRERRRREQGGRESKEEVEISCSSRELSHLPSTFYLCLLSQRLVSIYWLRALMKPPINPLLPTYFSDLADLSHHISPIYSTSLLITSLIPLPISTSPEAEVVRRLYLY